MKPYKIIASRSSHIIFDGRIHATSPRDARKKLKEALQVTSLQGIVYAITELPLELIKDMIRGEVAAQIAVLAARWSVEGNNNNQTNSEE
jgi:hypothetical protein